MARLSPPVAVTRRAATISTARARWASSTRAATPASPISTNYDDTLLWQSSNAFNVGLNLKESNTNFNQVAAGYFNSAGTDGNQDLVFQQGATTLVPYKNNRDGSGKLYGDDSAHSPESCWNYAGNYAISTVLLTDIDGDGNGDILALYHNLASNPSNPSASTSAELVVHLVGQWGLGHSARRHSRCN